MISITNFKEANMSIKWIIIGLCVGLFILLLSWFFKIKVTLPNIGIMMIFISICHLIIGAIFGFTTHNRNTLHEMLLLISIGFSAALAFSNLAKSLLGKIGLIT
jgi:hypothetical protein